LLALSPRHRIEAHRRASGFLAEALERNGAFALERMRSRLGNSLARLSGLNPAAVLARGYSIARVQPRGSIVRSSADVRAGDSLRIELQKGSIDCLVERVHE
jgi:exodeoxyribonuclease VII large subunit